MKQSIVCLTVILFLVGAAQATTIIGGSVGNGNFEDFSGAWLDPTATAGNAGINGPASTILTATL